MGALSCGGARVTELRERLARIPRRQLLLGGVLAVVAIVLLARVLGGSGGGSTPTASTPPAVTSPFQTATATAAGQRVVVDAHTPPAFADALRNEQVIVVGFVVPGVADSDEESAAIAGLASPTEAVPGVKYLVYDTEEPQTYGDLATILGVSDTPTVVIIGSNGKIANQWTGFVDAGVISAGIDHAVAGD